MYHQGLQHRGNNMLQKAGVDTFVLFLQNDAGAVKWPVTEDKMDRLTLVCVCVCGPNPDPNAGVQTSHCSSTLNPGFLTPTPPDLNSDGEVLPTRPQICPSILNPHP